MRGPLDFELAPQLVLRTSLHLADGRQDQKNRPVAEIRPADHLLNPVQEDRARRFKQHLLVVAVELPDREAAAAREPTQRVGEPNRQAGEIIECEQVTVIGPRRRRTSKTILIDFRRTSSFRLKALWGMQTLAAQIILSRSVISFWSNASLSASAIGKIEVTKMRSG